jgi:hypothetical protein
MLKLQSLQTMFRNKWFAFKARHIGDIMVIVGFAWISVCAVTKTIKVLLRWSAKYSTTNIRQVLP